MDPDMRRLWEQMEPLSGGLRLYGGTALALYLNHRESTDFDFATPDPVIGIRFVSEIPWLAGAEMKGGDGMVDALWHGQARSIKVTFMECGHMLPMPTRDPILTSHGVAVAHPMDIIASKIEACMNRGLVRDCEDIDASLAAWPTWFRKAVQSLSGRSELGVYARLAEMSECLSPERHAPFRDRLRTLAQGEGDDGWERLL